jgi:type VI secretion system protein VasD
LSHRLVPFLRLALCAAVASSAIGVALGALPACGQTAPPKEPEPCKLQILDLTIIASPRINQADNGEARPVQVRLYQLNSDVRINNATFEQVWKNDKDTLKEDLVKTTELTVYPDSRTDIKFERDEKATLLGAVALFKNPKGRSWYTILELPPPPGKGACFTNCPSGDCGDAGAKEAPPLNPHFVIWVDGSRIDEGSDHVDDYPESGRRVETKLPFTDPDKGGAEAPKGSGAGGDQK